MNIRTAPHPSARKVVAKGGGKQRTVEIDTGHSLSWNHGNAAGELARVLIQGERARELALEGATAKVTETGVTFTFPNVNL